MDYNEFMDEPIILTGDINEQSSTTPPPSGIEVVEEGEMLDEIAHDFILNEPKESMTTAVQRLSTQKTFYCSLFHHFYKPSKQGKIIFNLYCPELLNDTNAGQKNADLVQNLLDEELVATIPELAEPLLVHVHFQEDPETELVSLKIEGSGSHIRMKLGDLLKKKNAGLKRCGKGELINPVLDSVTDFRTCYALDFLASIEMTNKLLQDSTFAHHSCLDPATSRFVLPLHTLISKMYQEVEDNPLPQRTVTDNGIVTTISIPPELQPHHDTVERQRLQQTIREQEEQLKLIKTELAIKSAKLEEQASIVTDLHFQITKGKQTIKDLETHSASKNSGNDKSSQHSSSPPNKELATLKTTASSLETQLRASKSENDKQREELEKRKKMIDGFTQELEVRNTAYKKLEENLANFDILTKNLQQKNDNLVENEKAVLLKRDARYDQVKKELEELKQAKQDQQDLYDTLDKSYQKLQKDAECYKIYSQKLPAEIDKLAFYSRTLLKPCLEHPLIDGSNQKETADVADFPGFVKQTAVKHAPKVPTKTQNESTDEVDLELDMSKKLVQNKRPQTDGLISSQRLVKKRKPDEPPIVKPEPCVKKNNTK